jgi:uncharacterized protein YbcI
LEGDLGRRVGGPSLATNRRSKTDRYWRDHTPATRYDRAMTDVTRLGGETLSSISNAMVRLHAEHYGRGPVAVKSYLCDDWLFCILTDGLTAVERNLLEHGDHELVRTLRHRFQHNMGAQFTGVVEEITGRAVLTYDSQIVFEPHHVIEMFLLAPAADGNGTGA